MNRYDGVLSYVEIERRIRQAWIDVLALGDLEVHDHFTDLGGTSFQGLRLISRMKAEFGIPLRSDLFLLLPTVKAMADHVTRALGQPPNG